MAALRARVGDPEAALRHLDIFTRAFILRNGFHANGDQTKSGYSSFTYRPFTLEATLPTPEVIPPAPTDVAPDLNPPNPAAATPPQP